MKKVIFSLVSFSRLWKNEFRALVNRVVGFLDQYDPEALDLKFVYDKLVKAQAELRLLQVREGKHPKSMELSDNRLKREKLIRTLIAQIRVLKSANQIYTIPQLEIIAPFVERYLNPIVKVNSSVKTDILEEMYLRLDEDVTLQTAIVTLNLKSFFDELKVLQNDYNQIESDRSTSRSNRQKVITLDVRANSEEALKNLMNEIVLAQMKHPELDYNPLINSLNDTFLFYMSQAKSRTTYRKNVATSKVSAINTTTTAQNGNSGTVVI